MPRPPPQAAAVDPSNGFALSGLGWIYIHKKLYLRAQTCFSDAVMFNPRSSWALCGMGVVLMELHRRPETAVHYFKRAVEADPTNDWALVYLGLAAHKFRKQYEEAHGHYMAALSHNPSNLWASRLLSELFRLQGDGEQADLCLAEALAAGPFPKPTGWAWQDDAPKTPVGAGSPHACTHAHGGAGSPAKPPTE